MWKNKLNTQTQKALEKARKRIKAGEFVTKQEAKKRLSNFE